MPYHVVTVNTVYTYVGIPLLIQDYNRIKIIARIIP